MPDVSDDVTTYIDDEDSVRKGMSKEPFLFYGTCFTFIILCVNKTIQTTVFSCFPFASVLYISRIKEHNSHEKASILEY